MRPHPTTARLLATLLALTVGTACGSTRTRTTRSGSPSGPGVEAAPGLIRVLVYNIHAGQDTLGRSNLARVAEVVRTSGADVALLQEVDVGTQRSGGVDQVAELARLTGLEGAFGSTLDYQGGRYGIAVLSRWPIRSDTLVRLAVDPPQLRAGGSPEPRGALRVTVDAPGGPLLVVNTHLDPSRDPRYRLQEAAGVARAVAGPGVAEGRVIVGGDLNAEPGAAPVRHLEGAGWRDAWRACGSGPGLTFPAHAPVKRIDYALLGDGLACRDATVLESDASDHRPLLVTVAPLPSTDLAGSPGAIGAPGDALAPDTRRWVDETLASLTVREKAGQLVVPWVGGDYVPLDSPEFDRLASWVSEHGVGGLVLSVGMPLSYAAKINALQARARVPLLIASDMENGPGMRMAGIYSLPHLLPQGGGTAFPPVMALGATGSERLAAELGKVLAREARAVGVHINFGPVVDVNSNPANPIINTRSFGEDPALVGRLATAYIRAAGDGGLMTTAKHFPGHGDTSEDSHLELPVISADRARLDSVELPPFRTAVAAGVDAIMTAHIAVRGVEGPDAPPATLSTGFMTDLLRDEMGFRGLLVTDAMTMGGVADEFGGGDEVLIRALEAGADILLMPPDVGDAVDAVTAAVASGRITEARLDRSVRRLLEAKARAGLHRSRSTPLDSVDRIVGSRAHVAVAEEIAERSITLPRDRDGLVPLPDSARLLVVSFGSPSNPVAGRVFQGALSATHSLDVARVDARTTAAEWDALRARADSVDAVVVAVHARPPEPDLSDSLGAGPGIGDFVEPLAAGGAPVVVVSCGSPYLLDLFPSVGSYVLAWSGTDVSQEAAARALTGRAPVTGRLPVSLPPHHGVGEGLTRPGAAGPPPTEASDGGP
jgi:beta-N-acetylhexosaminidase